MWRTTLFPHWWLCPRESLPWGGFTGMALSLPGDPRLEIGQMGPSKGAVEGPGGAWASALKEAGAGVDSGDA